MATAQPRTARGAPPSALMYTRPWRSSPLAGPGFSTLPPIISESSEEAEHDLSPPESPRDFGQSRSHSSSSIVSHASASASGYDSRNASASASALLLFESEASRSSSSLSPSTSAHGTGTSSSHGHANQRSHRLSKSLARRSPDAPPRNVAEGFITPRAQTTSHTHSRPASYAGPAPSPSMPPSRDSPLAQSNTQKQPPSVSRDPTSNWMSSSPFGPATTPKFSRLSMASPAVVMPLSAREYRKRRVRDSHGKSKENDTPSSPNDVALANTPTASKNPNDVPFVKVSPPEEPHHPPPSPPGPQSTPQPHVDHTPKPLPQSAQSKPRYAHSRSRSRPTTPPRSSPLAAPPISPKSSAGTFFSVASTPDADTVFPALPNAPDPPASTPPVDNSISTITAVSPRPNPRLRRKSYPERLSNGTRLSLTEAMNRLSQESTSLHRLSAASQTDGANRFSVISQASGHTLFYDVESDDDHANVSRQGSRKSSLAPVLATQSLEDLSSTLARTGIEVVNTGDVSETLDDARKGKRNVRMVRISDTVEVSPAPVPRRRKLTKSRPGSIRVSPVKETNGQERPLERRVSLLPWKSKGTGDNKGGGASAGTAPKTCGEDSPPLPQETIVPIPIPPSLIPGVKPPSHGEPQSQLQPNNTPVKKPAQMAPSASPETSPSKTRRYTFSFFSSATFPLSRRQKSATLPAVMDLGLDKDNRMKSKGSITDGSIRTITQGSQSTLTLGSHGVYDLTTLASSGGLSGRDTGASTVPMLRRLNAHETELAGMDRLPSPWEAQGGSTPSLITSSSIVTSSSAPVTPSNVRHFGHGEPFVSRPSGLKESYTDTSEDDSEGAQGRAKVPWACHHHRLDPSPLARGAGASESEEEEGTHPRPRSGLLSPSPRRPGTPNSMLTTATETSASYASFSSVPTTVTSSRSTSPSTSSQVMGGRREWALAPQSEEVDGNGYACALCGHVASRSTSPALSETMHPMFTVPLVTVSASTVSRAHSATVAGGHVRRASSGRKASYKSERQSPGPVATSVSVGADKAVTTVDHKTTTDTSPAKMKKRRRPQTAPAGMGDVALKFIEQTQAKVDAPTKSKGHGRFKTVLQGLLKWNI